jgi:heavy metal sensor kinase
MFPKSIRWKIQAWHSSLLLCLVTGLLVMFYGYERNERLREIDSQLRSVLAPLLPALTMPGPGHGPGPGRGPGPRPENDFGPPDFPGPPPPPPRAREADQNIFAQFQSGNFYYVIWSGDGVRQDKSAQAPDRSFPGPLQNHPPVLARTSDGFRELIQYVPSGDCVVVGTSLAPMLLRLRKLAWSLVVAGTAVVAFGFLGGWWLAGRALHPLAEISATAEKIAGGDLSQRISGQDAESELGRLISVLNRMFERVEKAFAQQVRFTADASHELRTPISIMLTQIQLARSRPREAEFYRETLVTCERAAERMRVLVNSLLELARVDSGEFQLAREECDLARVAREALDFISPLATQKEVVVRESLESVPMRADPLRLGQMMINLLNNAIQHNAPGVEVSISLQRNGTHAILRVRDNGAGIPREALPQLFGRFYRADKARSRAAGNVGLGLAISKAIVEAHGGSIRVDSTPGQGSEFLVQLPL